MDTDTATISGSICDMGEVLLLVMMILQWWCFTLAFMVDCSVKGDLAHFMLRMSE